MVNDQHGQPDGNTSSPIENRNNNIDDAMQIDNDNKHILSLPDNRFELELEFLQCLASPAYLHHLATTGMLNDPQLLLFLEYLKYWKQPEYVRYVTFPHAFYFLDLLTTNERFRREIGNVAFRNFVHEQQFYSWQFRSQALYGGGSPVDDKTSGSDEVGERESDINKTEHSS